MYSNTFKYFWLFIILGILTFYGCAAKVHRAYEGPERPHQEVARVLGQKYYVQNVVKIDGKKTQIEHDFFDLGHEGSFWLDLLPGAHTVTVAFASGEERTIGFIAEAGKIYELCRWGDEVVLLHMQDRSFVAPTPSANEVIVRSPEPNHASRSGVGLVSIDGVHYSTPVLGFAVRLSPGEHSFGLSFRQVQGFFKPDYKSAGTLTVSGDLEPGCTYVIEPREDLEAEVWLPLLRKEDNHAESNE